MTPQPYQLFPPLRPEEYAALKQDIAARGVLVPIEFDDAGAILDGHHRAAIAAELGLEAPKVVRHFASEQAKREHVIKLNLARRHLDPIRWGQAFQQLLEVRGVSTGRGARNDQRTSATVAEVAAELGVPHRTARHRVWLARQFAALPPERQAVVTTPGMLSREHRELRQRQREEKLRQERRQNRVATPTTTEIVDLWTSPRRWINGAAKGIRRESLPFTVDPCRWPKGKKEYVPRLLDLTARVAGRNEMLDCDLWQIRLTPAEILDDPRAVAAIATAREQRADVLLEARKRAEAARARYEAALAEVDSWFRKQLAEVGDALSAAAGDASNEPSILVGRRKHAGPNAGYWQADLRLHGLEEWATQHTPDDLCACLWFDDGTPIGCPKREPSRRDALVELERVLQELVDEYDPLPNDEAAGQDAPEVVSAAP